jgi:hypothetical protein
MSNNFRHVPQIYPKPAGQLGEVISYGASFQGGHYGHTSDVIDGDVSSEQEQSGEGSNSLE